MQDGRWDGEQLILCHDRGLGLRAVIAIDDTTRGPALGGVRYAAYPSQDAAIAECTRLAAAMTRKNAAAGLPYGGAKSVILRDGEPRDRARLMRAFGRFVARLGGAYIPGVDVGTTVADLGEIATVVPDVACHDEDPSPWTALGVWAGIRAAVELERGSEGLTGTRVAVQGAGHVGAELVRLLREAGAEVVLADVDAARAAAVAERHGARIVHPDELLDEPCDVLAPCAMARVLDAASIARLRCAIVAGAANDMLATRADAERLAERGIRFVPDFLLSAGGVIQIHALRNGWSQERLREAILEIGGRVRATLETAAAGGELPLDVAEAAAAAAVGRELAGVA